MDWIRGGKRYNTATSKELHRAVVRRDGYLDCDEILYISPKDQPFIVRQYTVDDSLIEKQHSEMWLLDTEADQWAWLEKTDAPESAYQALGLAIEEG